MKLKVPSFQQIENNHSENMDLDDSKEDDGII